MAKIKFTWKHHVPGDKYERQFNIGEECPVDLVEVALAEGAIGPEDVVADAETALAAAKHEVNRAKTALEVAEAAEQAATDGVKAAKALVKKIKKEA